MKTIKPEKIIKIAETGRQFLIAGGRRRVIFNPQSLKDIKEKYPNIETITSDWDMLAHYPPGAAVPRNWSMADWIEPPQNKQKMREIIVSQISGKGVEYGAGSRPTPVPINVDVSYSEPYQSEDQYKRMNYNDNVVVPSHAASIDNQREFANDSLDFIIAAHVIEHTPKPVQAIVESYRTLKKGGQLVLIVPDKRHTFDRPREITTLQHLITDYEDYDRSRDLEHYYDFFLKVKRTKDAKEQAEQYYKEGRDTHFHVWDPASFHELLTYIVSNYAPYNSFEIKPRVDDKTCIEFYAVLTK